MPAAVAVAYLPLHRTRAITVTEATLTFGFRAASTVDAENVRELAELADLDLMQARRHAAVLAGHYLPLICVPCATQRPGRSPGGWTRWKPIGLTARHSRGAAPPWSTSAPTWATAAQTWPTPVMVPPLSPPPSLTSQDPSGAVTAEYLAAAVIEQALAIALVGARHLGHYRWDGVLATAQVMAAATWDLFQYVTWDHASCPQPIP